MRCTLFVCTLWLRPPLPLLFIPRFPFPSGSQSLFLWFHGIKEKRICIALSPFLSKCPIYTLSHICLSTVCLPTILSRSLSIYLPISQSISLFCVSVCRSICLSFYLSDRLTKWGNYKHTCPSLLQISDLLSSLSMSSISLVTRWHLWQKKETIYKEKEKAPQTLSWIA